METNGKRCNQEHRQKQFRGKETTVIFLRGYKLVKSPSLFKKLYTLKSLDLVERGECLPMPVDLTVPRLFYFMLVGFDRLTVVQAICGLFCV